jgi:hypothetical protein
MRFCEKEYEKTESYDRVDSFAVADDADNADDKHLLVS